MTADKSLQSVLPKIKLQPTRDDARYQGKVSVWYPFHPLHGVHDFSVVREYGCRDVHYVELAAQERQAVPACVERVLKLSHFRGQN